MNPFFVVFIIYVILFSSYALIWKHQLMTSFYLQTATTRYGNIAFFQRVRDVRNELNK